MIKEKEKRFRPGELVVVRIDDNTWKESHSGPRDRSDKKRYSTAIIIDGRETSLHVMDRPKKIIDTILYRVFVCGKRKSIFDEEIYKFSEDMINI